MAFFPEKEKEKRAGRGLRTKAEGVQSREEEEK
jgi:hypothetical protein